MRQPTLVVVYRQQSPGIAQPTAMSQMVMSVPSLRPLPEQKYLSDGGKKAPNWEAFSSNVRLGWDYPTACPDWPGHNPRGRPFPRNPSVT